MGQGLLILGPSGVGKSQLALELMAHGGRLVADDRTVLSVVGETLVAAAPAATRGLIEARGIGILRADPAAPTPLSLVADLGADVPERLPAPTTWTWGGIALRALALKGHPDPAPALLQWAKAGFAEQPPHI